MKNTLGKQERLKGKKKFEHLFNSSKKITHTPFRIIYHSRKAESSVPAKTAFSVPKKSFPKAVTRNRIKRIIREAFRKNKHELYEFLMKKNLVLDMIIIYTGKEAPAYREIERETQEILKKLISKL